jgi:hypothetical protein
MSRWHASEQRQQRRQEGLTRGKSQQSRIVGVRKQLPKGSQIQPALRSKTKSEDVDQGIKEE